MTITTLTYASATELARAIRDKEVSAVEVVDAHLRQIEAVNPRLNAVVQLAAGRARAEARAADAALAGGKTLGPLHGVPFTVKDNLDTAGIVSTGGTKGRSTFVPAQDATAVARLRAAGAILLGKTNTPELTLAYETDNLVYGRTNNPRRRPHLRRQQRRRGGDHRRRRIAARHRQRHRRQHPRAVALLRHRRHPADVGTRAADRSISCRRSVRRSRSPRSDRWRAASRIWR